MRESSFAILKKLTTGKKALSRGDFKALCRDIQAASIDDLAEKVFAQPIRPAAAKAEKPAWLSAMQATKTKRRLWTAPEFVASLYEIALERQWVSSEQARKRPATLSFPDAAKRIAAVAGGDELSRAFAQYIDKRVEQDRRS